MPSILNNLDTRFPTFTGIESTERKVNTIQDYLYQLTEELRYALHNIDTTNMNEQELDGFVQTITNPVYARIEDDEENISELAITAQGLSTRVGNAENSITSLNVTASGLSTSVNNLETGMSTTLRVSADGLSVTNASGSQTFISGGDITAWNISADNITAGTISAAVSLVAPTIYATGKNQYLEVTANGIAYNQKVGSSFQPSWSIGNSTTANNTLAINSYTDQGSIAIGCANKIMLNSSGGLILSGSMYGTLAQRNALTPTAGRLFFVRN